MLSLFFALVIIIKACIRNIKFKKNLNVLWPESAAPSGPLLPFRAVPSWFDGGKDVPPSPPCPLETRSPSSRPIWCPRWGWGSTTSEAGAAAGQRESRWEGLLVNQLLQMTQMKETGGILKILMPDWLKIKTHNAIGAWQKQLFLSYETEVTISILQLSYHLLTIG